MHDTARQLAKQFADKYILTPFADVLDVGSYDMNGKLYDVLPSGVIYTGIDIAPGPNVHALVTAQGNFPFDDDSFDFVVSSSCFEHDRFFWLTFIEMMRVLRPGGYIYINAPSTGPYHAYPGDCWRFYPDAGQALVDYARRVGFDCDLVECFIHPEGEFKDFVMVVKKNGND